MKIELIQDYKLLRHRIFFLE